MRALLRKYSAGALKTTINSTTYSSANASDSAESSTTVRTYGQHNTCTIRYTALQHVDDIIPQLHNTVADRVLYVRVNEGHLYDRAGVSSTATRKWRPCWGLQLLASAADCDPLCFTGWLLYPCRAAEYRQT